MGLPVDRTLEPSSSGLLVESLKRANDRAEDAEVELRAAKTEIRILKDLLRELTTNPVKGGKIG